MINTEDTALVMIDVQEKLYRAMHEKEALARNLAVLIKGGLTLEIPVIVTEQNPAGLGPTIEELAELMPAVKRIPKFSFSCCGEPSFLEALQAANRRNVLITGIETHICVYQTAVELMGLGYQVQLVADCAASRNPLNNAIGRERLQAEGAGLTTAEMALFELLKTAKNGNFAAIQKIVK